ncbi:exodeoxyribonuclease VII large subunit [Reichenbachiella carrageenanivorans]|uniref:Exodeoxyribonuclease 7 large subunit n=1 Tax=Reichenbachiella carrageenanivorans TaxID=2979869 RepID=A0ABY6CX73_9BACT|nr:exodeoxyribonuclease VII large subunit [Reichenbachiella carrageenanivorans]UXX78521.1 exodeoxyribonuclease VII large subunit [Reichenbachiella carrageenanivorans]
MNQYSLLEFNTLVKEVLADQLERSYWIVAEIGQLNLHGNGHCYLELVEKDNNYVKAKARGTIWANVYREIHPWFVSQTGTELKQGMKVLLNASLEFHEVYGLSLNIRDIDVNFTIGERERKKQETIQQLEAEGIMDMNQGLELPTVIQRIAIISSETAAGYEDFMNQFQNNPYGYQSQLDLYPATMQGDAAPPSMIHALHQIHSADIDYDAVIVIRGGGSKMDLDCFDDYELCAHLAQFPLPVITGIGHERDQAIADLVAHTRLKTPTSVAEFLLSRMMNFESAINSLQKSISKLTQAFLHDQKEAIQELNFRWKMSAKQNLQKNAYQLERYADLIQHKPLAVLKKQQSNLDHTRHLVDAYDPINLLKKGYSITRLNGKALKNQKIKAGDELETQTASKTIISTIHKIQ